MTHPQPRPAYALMASAFAFIVLVVLANEHFSNSKFELGSTTVPILSSLTWQEGFPDTSQNSDAARRLQARLTQTSSLATTEEPVGTPVSVIIADDSKEQNADQHLLDMIATLKTLHVSDDVISDSIQAVKAGLVEPSMIIKIAQSTKQRQEQDFVDAQVKMDRAVEEMQRKKWRDANGSLPLTYSPNITIDDARLARIMAEARAAVSAARDARRVRISETRRKTPHASYAANESSSHNAYEISDHLLDNQTSVPLDGASAHDVKAAEGVEGGGVGQTSESESEATAAVARLAGDQWVLQPFAGTDVKHALVWRRVARPRLPAVRSLPWQSLDGHGAGQGRGQNYTAGATFRHFDGSLMRVLRVAQAPDAAAAVGAAGEGGVVSGYSLPPAESNGWALQDGDVMQAVEAAVAKQMLRGGGGRESPRGGK